MGRNYCRNQSKNNQQYLHGLQFKAQQIDAHTRPGNFDNLYIPGFNKKTDENVWGLVSTIPHLRHPCKTLILGRILFF